MEMKNFFKTAIFAGTLAVGLTAAINFAPEAEAATYDYSNRCINSKGQSDFGIYNGKVINIKDFYHDYVSNAYVDNQYESGIITSKNTRFNNYKSIYSGEYCDYTEVYSDDPICAFVDKSCFRQEGDFFLMGDEYGYYVHTIKNQTYVYQSIVLLFDISYEWNYYSESDSTFQSVKIEVISQTAVCCVNAAYARNFYQNIDYYNDDAILKTSVGDYENKEVDVDHLCYSFSMDKTPFDGWIVCPVLERGFSDGTGGGKDTYTNIKQYSKLFLTDIQYRAEYSDQNGEVFFSEAMIGMNKVNTFEPEKLNEAPEDCKLYKYGKIISENLTNFVVGISPIGLVYSGLVSAANIYSGCVDVNKELYQSEFLEGNYLNDPVIAEDASNFLACPNEKTGDPDKFVIIGKNEGNASSITFETYFSNKNECFTDSIFTALPLRRVKNDYGDFAEVPTKITYMNNIYGDPAICSRRYMNYSRECPKMRDTKNLGDITRKPSSLNNISIEGTTPYISQFKVTNPGNYTFSVYGSTQEKTRIIIWDIDTKKAIYINDYCLRIDSSVYLPSGNYYIEISPKLDKASVNSIAKQIATKTELIDRYNKKINDLEDIIKSKEIKLENCDVDKEELKDYKKYRNQYIQEKSSLEKQFDDLDKKYKNACGRNRVITFTTSKLSSSNPKC